MTVFPFRIPKASSASCAPAGEGKTSSGGGGNAVEVRFSLPGPLHLRRRCVSTLRRMIDGSCENKSLRRRSWELKENTARKGKKAKRKAIRCVCCRGGQKLQSSSRGHTDETRGCRVANSRRGFVVLLRERERRSLATFGFLRPRPSNGIVSGDDGSRECESLGTLRPSRRDHPSANSLSRTSASAATGTRAQMLQNAALFFSFGLFHIHTVPTGP